MMTITSAQTPAMAEHHAPPTRAPTKTPTQAPSSLPSIPSTVAIVDRRRPSSGGRSKSGRMMMRSVLRPNKSHNTKNSGVSSGFPSAIQPAPSSDTEDHSHLDVCPPTRSSIADTHIPGSSNSSNTHNNKSRMQPSSPTSSVTASIVTAASTTGRGSGAARFASRLFKSRSRPRGLLLQGNRSIMVPSANKSKTSNDMVSKDEFPPLTTAPYFTQSFDLDDDSVNYYQAWTATEAPAPAADSDYIQHMRAMGIPVPLGRGAPTSASDALFSVTSASLCNDACSEDDNSSVASSILSAFSLPSLRRLAEQRQLKREQKRFEKEMQRQHLDLMEIVPTATAGGDTGIINKNKTQKKKTKKKNILGLFRRNQPSFEDRTPFALSAESADDDSLANSLPPPEQNCSIMTTTAQTHQQPKALHAHHRVPLLVLQPPQLLPPPTQGIRLLGTDPTSPRSPMMMSSSYDHGDGDHENVKEVETLVVVGLKQEQEQQQQPEYINNDAGNKTTSELQEFTNNHAVQVEVNELIVSKENQSSSSSSVMDTPCNEVNELTVVTAAVNDDVLAQAIPDTAVAASTKPNWNDTYGASGASGGSTSYAGEVEDIDDGMAATASFLPLSGAANDEADLIAAMHLFVNYTIDDPMVATPAVEHDGVVVVVVDDDDASSSSGMNTNDTAVLTASIPMQCRSMDDAVGPTVAECAPSHDDDDDDDAVGTQGGANSELVSSTASQQISNKGLENVLNDLVVEPIVVETVDCNSLNDDEEYVETTPNTASAGANLMNEEKDVPIMVETVADTSLSSVELDHDVGEDLAAENQMHYAAMAMAIQEMNRSLVDDDEPKHVPISDFRHEHCADFGDAEEPSVTNVDEDSELDVSEYPPIKDLGTFDKGKDDDDSETLVSTEADSCSPREVDTFLSDTFVGATENTLPDASHSECVQDPNHVDQPNRFFNLRREAANTTKTCAALSNQPSVVAFEAFEEPLSNTLVGSLIDYDQPRMLTEGVASTDSPWLSEAVSGMDSTNDEPEAIDTKTMSTEVFAQAQFVPAAEVEPITDLPLLIPASSDVGLSHHVEDIYQMIDMLSSLSIPLW